MLMSRIGQKKTVLLSLIVTFASLLLPVFGDSYALMLISFSLLGIGNALMQTSLNPLLSNIVRGDRLASSLTFRTIRESDRFFPSTVHLPCGGQRRRFLLSIWDGVYYSLFIW